MKTKKQKTQKSVYLKIWISRKLKFQDCKSCLEGARIENKINQLGKNKIDVDSLK